MKTFVHLAITFVATTVLLSCAGSSSDDAKNTDTVQPTELGYNPIQRWPEQGSYSYNIKYNYNGLECVTQKNFANKANYCIGLQDTKLNESCAQPSRRREYENFCGNDFQEINIPAGFKVSGFDQRLKKQCETGDPDTDFFPVVNQYCQFLKNETLHANCHWDQRFEKFKQLKCKNSFSSEPTATPTNPPPQPNEPIEEQPGNQQPQPPTDGLEQIEIVQQLRAAGVDVDVNWQAIRQDNQYNPGGISLDKKMQQFWIELASVKDEIIKRKSLINSIHVTSYTSYSSDYLFLSLQYDQIAGENKKYFPLLDQLITFKSDLGIRFNGIHGHGIGGEPAFSPLLKMLDLLKKNYTLLLKIKGVINEIGFESYSYYNASSQELRLKQSDAELELKRYLQLLSPLGPTYSWADKNSVKISGDFDIEKQSAQMRAVFKTLNENISSLDQMVKADMIKKLEIYNFSDRMDYSSVSKSLRVVTEINSQSMVTKALRTLGSVATKSLEIKKPFSIDLRDLSDDFYKAVELLESVWGKVKTKTGKIAEIRLSFSSGYFASSQSLIIGSDSTSADLAKIIDGIR